MSSYRYRDQQKAQRSRSKGLTYILVKVFLPCAMVILAITLVIAIRAYSIEKREHPVLQSTFQLLTNTLNGYKDEYQFLISDEGLRLYAHAYGCKDKKEVHYNAVSAQ